MYLLNIGTHANDRNVHEIDCRYIYQSICPNTASQWEATKRVNLRQLYSSSHPAKYAPNNNIKIINLLTQSYTHGMTSQ